MIRFILLASPLVFGCVERDLSGLRFGGGGGGGDGGSGAALVCEANPVGCGGEPRGNWIVSDACGSTGRAGALTAICPAATITTDTVGVTGRLEASLTNWNFQRDEQAVLEADLPASCNPSDCNALAASLLSALGEPIQDVTCTGAAECACSATGGLIINHFLPYSTNGNTIELETGDTFDYCVEGATMQLHEPGRGWGLLMTLE